MDTKNKGAKSYWDSLYGKNRLRGGSLIANDELEDHQREMRQQILRNYMLKQDGKVLEAGCGTGKDLRKLYTEGNRNLFVGLDYSAHAVQKCREIFNGTNCSCFVCGDILRLPFRDNTFDLVFNAGVIEHFKDSMSPFKEMIRVTKPEGYIVVFVPNTFSLWVLGKNLLNMLNKISFGKVRPWPVWERSFSRFSLKRLSRKLNLADIHVVGIHLLHYYWIIDVPEKAMRHSILPLRIKNKLKKYLIGLDAKANSVRDMFGMEIALIGKANKGWTSLAAFRYHSENIKG